ncbi:MAG: hypothetical protein RLZZ505_1329 [Verrucomicrobiota bacterium]|jgi:hypothetical protein
MIATAFPSEGIDEIWHLLSFASWCLATILGLIALILCVLPSKNRIKALWVAAAGGLLSIYPILFVLHIYRIDLVPVGRDGTPASPPLISAMAWPLMPLGVCLLAASIAYARRLRAGKDT